MRIAFGFLAACSVLAVEADPAPPPAALPEGRSAHTAQSLGGTVYVVGGHAIGKGVLASVLAYDAAARKWVPKADLPTPRCFLASAVVDGKLYAVGGLGEKEKGGENPLGTLERYDPAADRWESLPLMPTPRSRLAAAALDGKVYAVGGYDGEDKAIVEIFDPATNRWEEGPALPFAQHGHATVAVGKRLHVLGLGGDGKPNHIVLEGGKWKEAAPMPQGRLFAGAAVLEGRIYVVGGAGQDDPTHVYDPSQDRWTAKTPPGTYRCRFALVPFGRRLWAVAGETMRGGDHADVEAYDPAADRWE